MYNRLIIAGRGIRIANAVDRFVEFAKYTYLPIVTTILGKDLLDDSLSKGTIGIRGTANHLVDKATNLIIIGASLPIAQIGYDYKKFNKKNIVVVNVEKPNSLVRCKFIKKDAYEFLLNWEWIELLTL